MTPSPHKLFNTPKFPFFFFKSTNLNCDLRGGCFITENFCLMVCNLDEGVVFFCLTVGRIFINEIVWILIFCFLFIVVVYGCFLLFSPHFVMCYFYGSAITFKCRQGEGYQVSSLFLYHPSLYSH